MLRHFHMGTLMHIECRFDSDCLCSHQCALFQIFNMHPSKFDTHWSNPPPEVVWMCIQTGLLFIIHMRLCLPIIFGLVCGMCKGMYYITMFCSALVSTLGRKEARLLVAKKSSTARQMNDHNGFILLLCFDTQLWNCSQRWWDKHQNSLLALSWCFCFFFFDTV